MILFSEVSSVTYMLPKLYCMSQQASFLLGIWCASRPQSLSATQSVQTCTQTQLAQGLGYLHMAALRLTFSNSPGKKKTKQNTFHFSSPFACDSGGNPGSPCLGLWDNSGSSPSLANTRWVGWRQFCRKCFASGFFSGLSSWNESSQKALPAQPSFIASRAADGFPKHLKSACLPDA